MKTSPTSLPTFVLPLLLWAAALSVPLSLAAQAPDTTAKEPRFLVGISGGIHQVKHTLGNAVLGIENAQLGIFTASYSLGSFIGISGEVRLNKQWSIAADLHYNNLPGNTEKVYVNPPGASGWIEVIPSNGSDSLPNSDTVIGFKSDVSYSSISIAMLGKWRFSAHDSTVSFGLRAGPVIHYIVQKNMRQTQTLESPFNARLLATNEAQPDEGGKKRILYDGEIPNSKQTRLGIHIGLFAEFGDPWSGVMISPGIFYDYGLQEATTTESWLVSTLSGKLNLMVGL